MHIVITAREMVRLEELAIRDGLSPEAFMEEAGLKVAGVAEKMVRGGSVLLLVGKGNKGGDALVAGELLLKRGFKVDALMSYEAEECSELNQVMRRRFKGRVLERECDFSSYGLIIDGLLGTGFRGELEPSPASLIEKANHSEVPILAIDLPSGLNGTTGDGADKAIQASITVALGCAKSGFFLKNGWNSVGELIIEEFGLPLKYWDQAEVFAELPTSSELKMPRRLRNRHKYQAGYVVGFGGSKAFSGAPKLTSLAAFRSGAGIVKLFYPKEAEANMCCSFPELIHAPWDEACWNKELERASAIFAGPGLGSAVEIKGWLKKYLASAKQPCVLDADALTPDPSSWPKHLILTPHRGEVLPLLGLKKALPDEELFKLCQKLSDQTGAVLVLKGAPTWIFGPNKIPKVIARGHPAMATAGAGDVLTGILASLLAQGLSCWQAAILGTFAHALAGERAAREKTSYGLIASDLLEFISV